MNCFVIFLLFLQEFQFWVEFFKGLGGDTAWLRNRKNHEIMKWNVPQSFVTTTTLQSLLKVESVSGWSPYLGVGRTAFFFPVSTMCMCHLEPLLGNGPRGSIMVWTLANIVCDV